MALVTLLSDFGTRDHYVANLKAAIIQTNPGLQIIDISHEVEKFDIAHAAYILKNCFRNFPQGSVHLVSVNPADRQTSKLIAIKLEDHFFVGYDSGIFSLISEQQIMQAVELHIPEQNSSTFPAKEILAPVAAHLASGKSLESLGNPIQEIHRLISRQVKVTKREIAGNVVRVDSYGNLITNIKRKHFETINNLNGSPGYVVQFGRETARGLNKSFEEVEPGECFVLFNSDDNLQIGINKGSASDLLGLRIDTPITIQFN